MSAFRDNRAGRRSRRSRSRCRWCRAAWGAVAVGEDHTETLVHAVLPPESTSDLGGRFVPRGRPQVMIVGIAGTMPALCTVPPPLSRGRCRSATTPRRSIHRPRSRPGSLRSPTSATGTHRPMNGHDFRRNGEDVASVQSGKSRTESIPRSSGGTSGRVPMGISETTLAGMVIP